MSAVLDRVYHRGQQVKLLDGGEKVVVVDVMPLGQRIFYRVEREDGEVRLMPDTSLRSV
jgi:hypothetical protein